MTYIGTDRTICDIHRYRQNYLWHVQLAYACIEISVTHAQDTQTQTQKYLMTHNLTSTDTDREISITDAVTRKINQPQQQCDGTSHNRRSNAGPGQRATARPEDTSDCTCHDLSPTPQASHLCYMSLQIFTILSISLHQHIHRPTHRPPHTHTHKHTHAHRQVCKHTHTHTHTHTEWKTQQTL